MGARRVTAVSRATLASRLKPLLLSLGFLLAVPGAASGQALLIILFGDKLSTETFQLGINADLGWSGVSGIDNAEAKRSWSFGAYGEIKLSDNWRLQPELTIKTPGGAEGLRAGDPGVPFEPVGDSLVDEALASGSITRSTGYLSVPVYLKYVAGPLGIGAGGSLAYMTKAEDRLESDVLQGQLQLEQDIKDSFNRWDAGLVFSLDWSLKPAAEMRSLRINAKYYLGLMDTLKDNPGPAVKNSIFFIGLDIPVGGGGAAEAVEGS